MSQATPAQVFAPDPIRMRHMADSLDLFSRRRLADLGIGEGWQVLEVGAGIGSMATWIANRVGVTGHVTATDLDISRIPTHPKLTTLSHNLLTDSLESGAYDLIYARLVLGLMPHRWALVDKLSSALRPGGRLVIEEFSGHDQHYVVRAPETDLYRIIGEYHTALVSVLDKAGKTTSWDWEVALAMEEAGLVDVDSEMWTRSWHGGTAGCLLILSTLQQLGPQLIEAGMAPRDLDRAAAAMTDPAVQIYMHTLESVTARRPPR